MQIWFWAAVFSGVLSGFAGFILKLAAKRGYNSEVFVFYSAVISSIFLIPLAFFLDDQLVNRTVFAIALLGGIVAGIVGIFKVYALRYIDTTIYFPLFKLVSPALAIIFGFILFSERFTIYEWIGLILGLFVPLLLINRIENHRQNNLTLGLVFILITGLLAALVALINNYAVDISGDVWWITVGSSLGVLLASIMVMMVKSKLSDIVAKIYTDLTPGFLWWSLWRSLTISFSFVLGLYAFLYGGDLGIVYSIQALYIVIPIVLAIIFYREHWNWQKFLAVFLSIVALGFLG
jgi:drug/metabolite transporter (DMT)-like permease